MKFSFIKDFGTKHYKYYSDAAPENIEAYIKEKTEDYQKNRIRWGIFSQKNYKEYEASFSKNTFKMRRIIKHRNSFLPEINGEIFRHGSGTIIKVKFSLNQFVKIFMIIWMMFFTVGAAIAIVSAASGTVPALMVFAVIFIMLLSVVLMPLIGFYPEVRRSKNDLKLLFLTQKDPVPDKPHTA